MLVMPLVNRLEVLLQLLASDTPSENVSKKKPETNLVIGAFEETFYGKAASPMADRESADLAATFMTRELHETRCGPRALLGLLQNNKEMSRCGLSLLGRGCGPE